MGYKRWLRKCKRNFDAFGSPSVEECMQGVGYGMYSGPSGGGQPTGKLSDQRYGLLFDCCILRHKRRCCDKIGFTGIKLSNPTVGGRGMRRGGFINRGRFRG